MLYRLLADLTIILHLAFILFAVLGGLLAAWRPRLIWLHLPALAWGMVVQWADLICPLTYLENELRLRGGAAGYSGRFIEHYLMPVLYPAHLTLPLRFVLGAALAAVNLAVYAWLLARHRRQWPGRGKAVGQ